MVNLPEEKNGGGFSGAFKKAKENKSTVLIVVAIIIAIGLFIFSSEASAKPHQLTIEWPTTTCDGDALAATDLLESELIFDQVEMPM